MPKNIYIGNYYCITRIVSVMVQGDYEGIS